MQFQTHVLHNEVAIPWVDFCPAYYPGLKGPELADDVEEFLTKELSLGKLEEAMLKHLWYAGAPRAPSPLHKHLIVGRTIVLTERTDLHLIWTSDRRLFIKPLPRFLLDPLFWKEFLCCQSGCGCSPDDKNPSRCQSSQQSGHGSGSDAHGNTASAPRECPRKKLYLRATGFLYSWICLISYRSDFKIALNHNLLPAELKESHWQDWRKLASEVLLIDKRKLVHPRFLRAELRLARLDTIHRFTQIPPFKPYFRRYWDYGSLFRENLAWLATATVFVALVLTAMQVGLATDQLKESRAFMAASYGFTVFAILGPLGVVGLLSVQAAWNFAEYLLGILGKMRKGWKSGTRASSQV